MERVDGVRLLVHEQELTTMRSLIGEAEAASAQAFRATYL